MQEFAPPDSLQNTGSNNQVLDLEEVETRLMLDAIVSCYGFDFRDFESEFLKAKINLSLEAENAKTISELQARLLHDRKCFDRFLKRLSSPSPGMYENPDFFIFFRNKIIPFLKTYPSLRIWCAGCGTGEEIYTLAILLKEEQLDAKTTIYATETNETVLKLAEEGRFSHPEVVKAEENYLKSGGARRLSDYYALDSGDAVFDASLKQKICFALHNPITDGSFNEFHVIICRNFLSQLRGNLEDKVIKLFRESLIPFGFLCLGKGEVLCLSSSHSYFELIDSHLSTYRKTP